MTLAPLFHAKDVTTIDFLPSDGLIEPDTRYSEPGEWWNCQRKELCSVCFPAQTQIEDYLIGGGASNGQWTMTLTPILTQNGAAAADAMGPATIGFLATGESEANVVLALIAAINTGANLQTFGDPDAWNRFRSYVLPSVSPTGATTIRFASVAPGQTYSLVVTPPAGSTAVLTLISAPGTSTIKVGFYVAIDRTAGTNGFNQLGQPLVKEVEASTPAADIIGPVFNGVKTEPVDPGFAFREYAEGAVPAVAGYGNMLAYGEAAIATVGGPVYVRHTVGGDLLPGMAADATVAAAGATANLWTMTPTVVSSTRYQLSIQFGTATVVLDVDSDASATDVEINDAMRVQLALYTGVGGLLEGLVGSGTTTFIITGPADGRSFTPASINVPGDMGEVETTAGVTTHTLFARDKFAAPSTRLGSVPVDVPHSNA